MKYTIGYIDEDIHQVAKYERELREYFIVVGYEIPNGLPLEDLLDQVYKSEIDLLLVDYLLVDKGVLTYNGDEVVRAYEEIKPRFPMIIFTNEELQAFPHVDNPNIIYDKGEIAKNKAHLAEIFIKNIQVYKTYISKRKETINILLEKLSRERLSSKEKHELLQCQMELNSLDKWSTEVPFQLQDVYEVDELAKTAKEAEDFLESLINNPADDSN